MWHIKIKKFNKNYKILLINWISIGVIFLFELPTLHAQGLFVEGSDGTHISYSFNDIQNLSFEPGNLLVNKANKDIDVYSLGNIRCLSFNYKTLNFHKNSNNNHTILLYPNPAKSILNIQFSNNLSNSGLIEIISVEGKTLYHVFINSTKDNLQIDVSNMPNGIYICKFNFKDGIETVRFVKQ